MVRRDGSSRAAHPPAVVAATEQQPQPSRRVRGTDAPCIVKTKALVASTPGTLSLAQGIVHWAPPPEALAVAASMAADPAVSQYGPDEGLPALREALRRKIREENGLEGVSGTGFGDGDGGRRWRVGECRRACLQQDPPLRRHVLLLASLWPPRQHLTPHGAALADCLADCSVLCCAVMCCDCQICCQRSTTTDRQPTCLPAGPAVRRHGHRRRQPGLHQRGAGAAGRRGPGGALQARTFFLLF